VPDSTVSPPAGGSVDGVMAGGLGGGGLITPMAEGCPKNPAACEDLEPGVEVYPKGFTATDQPWKTGGLYYDFIVRNVGPGTMTFTLSCSTTTPAIIAGCSVATSTSVTAASDKSVRVTYTTGSSGGTGVLRLTASNASWGLSDTGTLNVPVKTYLVGVSPVSGTTSRPERGMEYSEFFRVTNTGTAPNSYSLSRTCAGNITCGSPSPATTPTLAPGAGLDVRVTYATGAVATGGKSGTITLSAAGQRASAASGAYSVVIQTSGVAVTPDNATGQLREENTNGHREVFTVTNVGDLPIVFQLTCGQANSVTACAPSRGTLSLAGGASDTVSVGFNVLGAHASGRVTLTAQGSGVSDTGSKYLRIARYQVAVTPKGARTVDHQANRWPITQDFWVYNRGTEAELYQFRCRTTAGLSCDATAPVGPATQSLQPNDSVLVKAKYGTGLNGGDQTLWLTAWSSQVSDSGHVIVPVTKYAVSLATVGSEPEREIQGSYSTQFKLRNTGNRQDTYRLTCTGNSLLQCNDLDPLLPLTLAAGAESTLTVPYRTLTGTGTGQITLRAESDSNQTGASAVRSVYVFRANVAITPQGAGRERLERTGPHSEIFHVKNTGSDRREYAVGCHSQGPVLCGAVSPASVTLDPGDSASVAASYHTDAAGLGDLHLVAENAYASDTGYYSIDVRKAGPPIVRLLNAARDSLNLDRTTCLTAGAGEAAASVCGDLVVAHALPAYRTLGRDRTLTLHYNSATATGLALVAAYVTQPSGRAKPLSTHAILRVGTAQLGIAKDSAAYAPGSAGETRQVVLAVGRGSIGSLPTGVYPVTLTVRNVYSNGVFDAIATGEVIVINRQQSEFGSGWTLAGVERLIDDPLDANRRLWVAGDGSARLYSEQVPGSGVFQGTPGSAPDSLVRYFNTTTQSYWYRRNLRHGAAVLFDEQGRHRETVNRVGARTSFHWSIAGGQPRLVAIDVPPNDSTPRRYSLKWSTQSFGVPLQEIVDPVGRRLLKTSRDGVLLHSLLDPDGRLTRFTYNQGRMTSRVQDWGHRVEDSTVTTYEYANGARLTRTNIQADSARTQWQLTS
jgi:hypothetical protein